jgi:hypothetical protein
MGNFISMFLGKNGWQGEPQSGDLRLFEEAVAAMTRLPHFPGMVSRGGGRACNQGRGRQRGKVPPQVGGRRRREKEGLFS